MNDRTCLECGQDISGTHGSTKRCSAACRKIAELRRSRETWDRNGQARLAEWRKRSLEARKRRAPITCGRCGAEFCYFGRGAPKRFCQPCAEARQRDMNRGVRFNSIALQCSQAECDRPLKSRGMCGTHYRQWQKREGVYSPPPSDAWSPKRRVQHDRRRALKRGASNAMPIDRVEVFARDGYICHICAESIPLVTCYPHPLSASIDHVIPLARGGEHVESNVAASHLRCNIAKGARS